MKRVAIKPKLGRVGKKRIRRRADNDYFFTRIVEHWESQQNANEVRHQWQGWCSPSAQLSGEMCIEEFFEKVDAYLKFDEAILPTIKTGIICHTGFTHLALEVPGLIYAAPFLQNKAVADWYRSKVYPEFPIWRPGTSPYKPSDECEGPFKGKADFVIEREGRPAIVDLKNTFTDPDYYQKVIWPNQLPKISDIWQCAVYCHEANVMGMFDADIHWMGIAYVNWRFKPFSKYWKKMIWIDFWNDYRKKTARLVAAIDAGWREKLAGESVRCRNRECSTHGR
jgi:hypothetical protein